MNKTIKKILFLFIAFGFLLLLTNKVSANSINKINMDVYIDDNGNANVMEIWNASLTQGTEGYRAYSNLGNSSITNFKVSDDSGKTYETLTSWNTKANFSNKAYKCGINHTSSGLELCWGISNYGSRTYTLKYNINNLVTQYKDTQGIYFNFLNLDQHIGNAKITIHSNIPFSLENSRIWAFGNNGTINFENGNIVLDSKGSLSSSQYMVGLVRFESNIFNTKSTSKKTFDDMYDEAFSDVEYNSTSNNVHYSETKNEDEEISPVKLIIGSIGTILFGLIPFSLPAFFIILALRSNVRHTERFDYGPNGKRLPNDDEIEYYRDIPCNKDLEMAYWICYTYDVISIKELKQGIIGAILLKWIKNGYIKVTKTRKGLFSFKDNNYAIDFTQMQHADNEIENDLFQILVLASGSNRVLEAKEFKKWSEKNYYRVNNWFSRILEKEQSYLENKGLIITTSEERKETMIKREVVTFKKVSEKLREEAINLKGLKKFLLDYSMMPEREYFEVHLWEEYLIFAELLGIADKVEEQFSKLYPNFNQETLLNTEVATIATRSMAAICYEGVRVGKARAEARASRDYSGSSTSSGGGGSSYSSGGGSSGGSSGGGFR